MDGYALRCVLDCQIGFGVLLAGKQLAPVGDKKPFTGARDIIELRKSAKSHNPAAVVGSSSSRGGLAQPRAGAARLSPCQAPSCRA